MKKYTLVKIQTNNLEKISAIQYFDKGLKRAEKLIRYFIKETDKIVDNYFRIPQFHQLPGKWKSKAR